MSTVEAQKRSQRAWQLRRRADGWSWLCIASNHALCRGWFGRLKSKDEQRAPCTCRCHKEDPFA